MNRRNFIQSALVIASAANFTSSKALSGESITSSMLTNKIPSSAESIPVIGMGTNRNLTVHSGASLADKVTLIKTFFELGGEMLDSSPMYGQAEEVIGQCLRQLNYPPQLFSTTKVWTKGKAEGIAQMRHSMKLWGLDRFDLMQIHNLVDWKTHLKTLRQWKDKGLIKHIGITTSHGRDRQELESIMKNEQLDFIQVTYNIRDREVENRLLPLALEKGIAVIVNRPFNGLFGYTQGKELPDFAKSLGCSSWAQFYLKFAVSHPAVTCAIPATSKIKHLKDNMDAGRGLLPDNQERQKMVTLFAQYL